MKRSLAIKLVINSSEIIYKYIYNYKENTCVYKCNENQKK